MLYALHSYRWPIRCFFAALWRTYPPNTNYGLLPSLHKAPITDLHWSLFSSLLYTVSADHTMVYTDVATGERTRKIRAHRGIINTLDRTMGGGAGIELVATGSDDGTVKIWEGGHEANKQSVATFELGCPVTAVCWSADGSSLYIGALDNEIHVCIHLPVPVNAALTEGSSRSTISASKQKYRHYPVTQTLQLQLHSPPTGPSSSPPHSHHRPLFTTCDRSPHLRRAYTEYLGAPPRVSKTHYSRGPGARTTVGNASALGVLTERLPFGTLRAQRSYTRCGRTPPHPFKGSHPLPSYPAIRVQSLRLTFTQRNQLVSQPYPITFHSLIYNFSVLTGGKDGIMLVGEIEQGISV